MASIRKRGNAWQARVSRQGFPAETKTFNTRQEAERWSRSIEAAMDTGSFTSPRPIQDLTLGDLVARYRVNVTPLKRGAVEEVFRLKALERSRLGKLSLTNLTPEVVAGYRDDRLKSCCNDTVIRDLAVLSSIFSHAAKEWGLRMPNPVALIRKPKSQPGRNRTLTCEEETRLMHHARAEGRRNSFMVPLLTLALETAMRRGELLSLRWELVDLERRIAHLPLTKNGLSRFVPLSTRAVETLRGLPRSSELVFPWKAPAVSAAFDRLRIRASLQDLRFHDLRHTATTRIASKLTNVIELAAVTGHQSLQVLKRYYHPDPEMLARKLG